MFKYVIIALVVLRGIQGPSTLLLEANMKKINISTKKYPNTFTMVDDEDFEYLNQWKWLCSNNLYVIKVFYNRKEQKKTFKLMHREIMKIPKGMYTDHINHDTLDNRKCNLRICTNQENSFNSKLNKNNTSGYKGVSWEERRKKWRASINKNQKQIHSRYFDNELKAAKQYDIWAKELFKQFANFNVI